MFTGTVWCNRLAVLRSKINYIIKNPQKRVLKQTHKTKCRNSAVNLLIGSTTYPNLD